ncbi:PREDICTED: uncharacterized protein LOC105462486 isoform X2 [Wasmannia auropunctata]|nr:PREDICTED: uncharacterized protein LOC105462486 isoform X2 [Wasmannia auropunctata]
MALCLLTALLFLIDITMVLVFWKRKCSACCKRYCNNVELLSHKGGEPSVISKTETMRHDVTTSLSDVRVPHELEDVAMPDHCYRKVEYPRRREYVDCPTCVPSLCNLDNAQIQTEPKKMSVVESQTPRAITKETPMQTSSKCEFCEQQIQFAKEASMPDAHNFPHSSQWSYPAIVQFIRGGVSAPCCPGCKCAMNTTQTQQQRRQQQQQPQQLTQQRAGSPEVSNSNKTTSETTQQVTNSTESGNVTGLTPRSAAKYTVSFYSPDRKMQTVPDVVHKQKVNAMKMKEDARPTREDIDRELAKEVRAKTKGPKMIEKKKRKNERSIEESEEEKTIEGDKIERSKGGGEHHGRVYQEFMRRATERGSVTNLEESPTHTNRTLITPPSNRTRPRALLCLKSNKVDPINDTSIFDEDCIAERMAPRELLDNQAVQESEHVSRTGSPNFLIKRLDNACLSYRRQKSLTPTSDNSRCYSVFKDRKGRYFCEFCAPEDTKKTTSRLEGTDLRKLRCINCLLRLRDRGVKTNVKLKSDTCSKYGQSQRRVTSPSFT